MKLVNFLSDGKIYLGIKVEQGIINVEKEANKYFLDAPTTIEEVIAGGHDSIMQLEALVEKNVEFISEDKIVYAPCINKPEKIICVGLNYIDHGKECNMNIPKSPVLFNKFNNALAAHKQIIKIPQYASKIDYEVELVIIIGKEVSNILKEDAYSCIFGYTIGNDLSARDLQFLNGQWMLGKTCDNFAPIGPYIVTADEINPENLDIKSTVNGVVRQSANTCDLIFDCAELVSYISKYMTLKKGDVIFTGTPSGVILGYPEEKQIWLKSGDEIVASIEGIGSLKNILG